MVTFKQATRGRASWISAVIGSFVRYCLALVLLVAVFLQVDPASAAVRTVTVGVYENPPKVFTSATGKPSGIFIEIIEQIAKNEGWNLRYVSGSWAEGLERLAKGEIDLMPDVAYMAGREKIYLFHKVPVLTGWSQVYARKGSGIQSILDLNGKRIAALENSLQLETFTRMANNFGLKISFIPVPDYKTEFEMIAAGKADAGLTNRFYGLMHARKAGLEDTPIMFDPAPFFFAAPKNASGELSEIIDRHLSQMKKDPQSAYYAAMKRWTSEEVQFSLPKWLQLSGLVLGVVLLMSLVGSFVLKHQVNARTRELKLVNQEMEQRIDERTLSLQETNIRLRVALEDLAHAKERAEAADRLKSAFLATMSHELRTPLNSIIGFTGILLQGLGGPVNEEQTKQLNMVKNSASHLLSLISDVLDISKIEAGQLKVVKEPFNLQESVYQMTQSIRPLVEKKGLELSVEVAPEVGTITNDVRRVEQVLLNLLSNAVKFTEKGGISVRCGREGGYYAISVTDTGIGIVDGDLERLFEPFHQIDSGLSRKYEGTGLGLSICKKLVELMGGSIRGQSCLGKGSTFGFTVPVNPGSKQADAISAADFGGGEDKVPASAGSVEQPEAKPALMPASVDRERVEALCRKLAELLGDDDASAGDLLNANRALLKGSFPDEFSVIEGLIRRFDFEGALAALGKVMKVDVRGKESQAHES
ncbi:transporter substrate-binding domain-containing protein [Geobacter pelophilus]|uniref:histidine kinase n=1 Tax=Geoanaerobacter pelophilus TaxID=60036 RepID=A0AAW4L532_9BACT|nr:ATP-binding protein [Geoanaerobacter pelophilus]MBT0664640.1 transporter substrate-binding domain-containing protein [Geoanaerobacter pelophilus]